MRNQRRTFASAKALTSEKKDAERDRIKAALKNVEREAKEMRIRSSPCAKKRANLARQFEAAISDDLKPSTRLMVKQNPLASIPRVSTELAEKKGANTSIMHSSPTNQFVGSMSAILNAPIPQSPISDITNCMGSFPDISSRSFESRLRESPRTQLLVKEDQNDDTTIPENEPAAFEKQKQSYQKHVDPRKEWELAPLNEALHKFIQSDEIFQRPPCTKLPPDVQNTSSYKQKQNKPMRNITNKHSIMALLQRYDQGKDKLCATNGNLPSETKLGAQTQTESIVDSNEICLPRDLTSTATRTPTRPHSIVVRSAAKMAKKADDHVCSSENADESFPSYYSKSVATAHSPVKRSKVQREESFPSYDSTSVGMRNSIGGRTLTSALDRHVESVQKSTANGDGKVCSFLENNKKGCAWVFDFNGDGDVVGHDDESHAENSIDGDIDHASSSQTEANTPSTSDENESKSEDNEYDSSFLSEED